MLLYTMIVYGYMPTYSALWGEKRLTADLSDDNRDRDVDRSFLLLLVISTDLDVTGDLDMNSTLWPWVSQWSRNVRHMNIKPSIAILISRYNTIPSKHETWGRCRFNAGPAS